MPDDLLYLYGGDQPWDSTLWVTTDDRVRGGASTSELSLVNPERARFHGVLDTTALGGAGFASQHSLGVLAWDLRAYDGLLVASPRGDGKRYVVTLKDDLPGRRPDGRERSGLSWEADVVVGEDGADVFLPWDKFTATYRGRDKPDAEPLDLGNIKRIGLMMRSFFGEQEGAFSIDLHAIAARRRVDETAGLPSAISASGSTTYGAAPGDCDDEEEDDDEVDKKSAVEQPRASAPWWKELLCWQ